MCFFFAGALCKTGLLFRENTSHGLNKISTQAKSGAVHLREPKCVKKYFW